MAIAANVQALTSQNEQRDVRSVKKKPEAKRNDSAGNRVYDQSKKRQKVAQRSRFAGAM